MAVFLDDRRVPVKSSERKSGDFPYYGASGVVDWIDDYIFEGEHLLVAEDGENLRSRNLPIAFLADGKFWVNNHAHVLKARKGNNLRYLSYAIETADVTGFLTGTAQPKLSQGSLARLNLPAPAIEVQVGIAEVLGALDDKIAINLRLRDAAGKLMVTHMGRAAEAVRVGDLVAHSTTTVNPMTLGADEVRHYSLPAFDDGQAPVIESADGIMSNKFAIDAPSVLVSKLNPRFPRIWDVSVVQGRSLASTEFVVLQPREVSTSALFAALSQPSFSAGLLDKVTGTSGSHQRVRPQEILDALVPDPRTLAPEVLDLITNLGKRLELIRAESQRLAALRDALLPELMAGRLRVKDAEKQVEEVL